MYNCRTKQCLSPHMYNDYKIKRKKILTEIKKNIEHISSMSIHIHIPIEELLVNMNYFKFLNSQFDGYLNNGNGNNTDNDRC